MTQPAVIGYDPRSVPFGTRLVARLVVVLARLLALQPPARIRRVLSLASRGARSATFDEAKAARAAVVAVSYYCAGREGCLPRAIATVLLGRTRGVWPTWCVGVRNVIPFGAHAWVEADGIAVDEPHPENHYKLLMSVPPR